MRKILLLLIFLSVALSASAQINPASQIRWPAVTGTIDPASPDWPCTAVNYGQPYTNVSSGASFVCVASGWTAVSGGGGNLSGTLTPGYVPIATGTNTLGDSLLDYGITTAGTFTFAAPIAATTFNGAFINVVATSNLNIGGSIPAGTTGVDNTACGQFGLLSLTSGNYNFACGLESLVDVTTGLNNTAGGYQSGANITTGSGNVAFGSGSGPGSTYGALSGTLAFGMNATPIASYTGVIGGPGLTDVYFGGTTSPSAILHAAGAVLNGLVSQPCIGTDSTGLLEAGICSGSGGAVLLAPTTSQTVAQTGNNQLSINTTNNGNYAPINLAQTIWNYGPGFSYGNSPTAAQGWAGMRGEILNISNSQQGINQVYSLDFDNNAIGDIAAFYGYVQPFGGQTASNDEGANYGVMQLHQKGAYTGIVSGSPATGATTITTTGFGCVYGYCATQSAHDTWTGGGYIFDSSQPVSTATTATQGNYMGGISYTITGGTVPVSTAWGDIIPSSCLNNGNGEWQEYVSTTCLVGTSSSPGNFVSGSDVYLVGPFTEEAAATAVDTTASEPVTGVSIDDTGTDYATAPTVVFTGGGGTGATATAIIAGGGVTGVKMTALGTGYATAPTVSFTGGGGTGAAATASIPSGTYNAVTFSTRKAWNGGTTLMMQGGPGGDVFVASGTGTTPWPYGVSNWPISYFIAGAINSTTLIYGNCLGGECGGGGTLIPTATPITLFPSAEIIGSNGSGGSVNLGTNQIAASNGDTLVGAPTSQYVQVGLRLAIGQTTPWRSNFSGGIDVQDDGPFQENYAYRASNNPANGVAPQMFSVFGSYGNDFYLRYAPTGSLIYVQGGSSAFNLFEDDQAGSGATIGFDPNTNIFNFTSPYTAVLQQNGIDVCLQDGTNCPTGGGGTPGGSTGSMQYNSSGSFAGLSGTGPSYLNGSSAPTIETSAEALSTIGTGNITNTYIANPSMTINGTTCTLGGSCAPTNAPPVDVQFYKAATEDGGSAFASVWTRYDNNQPQTGSVAPATSTLAYFAYQATPSLPQYAETIVSEPPYWTGTSFSIDFFASVTSGTVIWDVQSVCVPANAPLTSSFNPFSLYTPTDTTVTTTVSSTAYGLVTTAVISNVAAPGVGNCPSSPTTPTQVVYRIYRDASDTAAANVNFLGTTFQTTRSQ